MRRVAAAVFATCCLLLSVVPAAAQTDLPVDRPTPNAAVHMREPARLCAGPGDTVLASDFAAGAVFALDKQTLEPVWFIQVDGNPLGVAWNGDLVFISNAVSANVEVFDVSGKNPRFAFALGHPSRSPQAPGFFQEPGEIAVDPEAGRVFVLDKGDKKVKLFDLKGNVVTEFQVKDGAGRVLLPTGLAVDIHRSQVLVSDYGDPDGFFGPNLPARVLMYDYDGNYAGMINGNGVAAGTLVPELQFSRPQGLTVNAQGWLFMTEALLGQVYIFDLNQVLDSDSVALVGKLPGNAEGLPGLKFPLDVMIDAATGNLLVTSRTTDKVVVFVGAGGTP